MISVSTFRQFGSVLRTKSISPCATRADPRCGASAMAPSLRGGHPLCGRLLPRRSVTRAVGHFFNLFPVVQPMLGGAPKSTRTQQRKRTRGYRSRLSASSPAAPEGGRRSRKMGRRSKKSQPAVVDLHRADEPMVGGIAQVVFDKLVGNVTETGQRKDDAGMAYASCWKSLKDRGVNTDPLKVALKLRKQDERKSAAWIRSFMEFVGYFGLLAQQELPLEQHAENDAGAAEAAREYAEDGDQQRVADDVDDDTSSEEEERDEEPIEVADCEKSDWGDDGPPAIVDVPEDAGAIFNAGATSAKNGGAAGENPHETGTESHRLWASGFESVGDDGLEITEFLRRTADQAAPAAAG